MTFDSPKWFFLFVAVWVIGGNLLAWHLGLHFSFLGYCQGWGCGE